jgi:hypothetical protein
MVAGAARGRAWYCGRLILMTEDEARRREPAGFLCQSPTFNQFADIVRTRKANDLK